LQRKRTDSGCRELARTFILARPVSLSSVPLVSGPVATATVRSALLLLRHAPILLCLLSLCCSVARAALPAAAPPRCGLREPRHPLSVHSHLSLPICRPSVAPGPASRGRLQRSVARAQRSPPDVASSGARINTLAAHSHSTTSAHGCTHCRQRDSCQGVPPSGHTRPADTPARMPTHCARSPDRRHTHPPAQTPLRQRRGTARSPRYRLCFPRGGSVAAPPARAVFVRSEPLERRLSYGARPKARLARPPREI
jgi:hypothetical protein